MQYKYAIQICIFLAVVFFSIGVYVYVTNRKAQIRSFLEDDHVDIRQKNTLKSKYLKLVHRYFGGKGKSEKINEWLLKANIHRISAEEVLGISMALGIALGGLFFIVLIPDYMAGLFFGLIFGLLSYKIPETIIIRKAKLRNRKANSETLEYMGLLSTAISAGLTPDQSMKKICQYSTGVLVDEFEQALGEVAGGQTKKVALSNIAKRLSLAPDSVLLVEAIIQAEESGQPISKVLAEQAESISARIENKAIEMAQKANTKLLAPIIIFIVLPMMFLIVGPALMQLGKVLAF